MNRRQFLAASIAASVIRPAFAGQDDRAAQRYGQERKFAETRFGRISYVERGAGPVLLLLHGFPLSNFQWRAVMDLVSADRCCLAPDWMGLGRTETADGQEVTPAAQTEMLASFLDRLGVKQVDIIANDSGGAIAQLFMTRYRDRVRSALLTNCDVETDSPPPAVLPIIDLARAGLYPELYLEPWLLDKEVARSATGLGGMCYADPRHPTDAALEQYLRPLVSSPARKDLVNRYTLGLTPNPLVGITEKLRDCTVPTRIVWGMSDTIFSTKSPDYLAGLLPKFDGIRRIEKAKLFFPEEYPDAIAAEAKRLWAVA